MNDQAQHTLPNCGARSYWRPDGITCSKFRIPRAGLSEKERTDALAEVTRYVEQASSTFLGYQSSQAFNNRHLAAFFNYAINNIGDPFSNPEATLEDAPDGYFTLNCKWMERSVLDYFARLWHAKSPHLSPGEGPAWRESYWGYVLSMGSTEGNLVALRSARDYLNGTRLRFEENAPEPADLSPLLTEDTQPTAYQPVLFYSKASHYSVRKLATLLQLETFEETGERLYPGQSPIGGGKWPESVGVEKNGQAEVGSIDVEELVKLAEFFMKKGHPIAVVFNYGTTFTGAYDDVERAVERLIPLLKKYGLYERTIRHEHNGRTFECRRKGFWFHTDGALGAAHVPFLPEIAATADSEAFRYPLFDFKLDIQSIVVSGHKWFGAAWPCGVFMTQNRYLLTNDVPEYVGVIDSTLAGSRNGLASLVLWDQMARTSDADKREAVQKALSTTAAAYRLLDVHFSRRGRPRVVHRAPGSLAVVFPRPEGRRGAEIIRKYALASTSKESHIFCMPHVKIDLVQDLIKDLARLPAEQEALEVAAAEASMAELRAGW